MVEVLVALVVVGMPSLAWMVHSTFKYLKDSERPVVEDSRFKAAEQLENEAGKLAAKGMWYESNNTLSSKL